jgi:hypothetical protein
MKEIFQIKTFLKNNVELLLKNKIINEDFHKEIQLIIKKKELIEAYDKILSLSLNKKDILNWRETLSGLIEESIYSLIEDYLG